jgi:transposase
MPRGRRYPPELLERGVRLVFESGRPVSAVARDLGVHSEALRKARAPGRDRRRRAQRCE